MKEPSYSPTFSKCLSRYGEASYEVNKLALRLMRHAIVGSVALGYAISSALIYFLTDKLSPNWLYLISFLMSVGIVGWCSSFLCLNQKRYKALKTKEFMAWATLDELRIVDYIKDT